MPVYALTLEGTVCVCYTPKMLLALSNGTVLISSWMHPADKQQNFGQGSKLKSWRARRRVTGRPGRLPDTDKMVSLEAYIKHVKMHHDFDLTNSFEKHILNICKRTIVMSQTQPIQ